MKKPAQYTKTIRGIMPIDTIFFILIFTSAATDSIYGKIYNYITLPAIISGLLGNVLISGIPGLVNSFIGLVTAIALLLPFFISGGMGAGDVKLVAAVGSLKGWKFVMTGGFYGAIIAGIIALVVMLKRKIFVKVLKKIFYFFLFLVTFRTPVPIDKNETVVLPYGFFLCIGYFIHWYLS